MRVLISIFICSLTFSLASQGFRSRYHAPQASQNYARDIFEISPGQYVGAGFVTDTSTGVARTQITMMGLDANGQIQWVNKHHGGSVEYLNNDFVARCFYKQGNFIYYAGCAHDSDGGNGRQIGVFLKYNLNGDTVWRKIYRSTDSLEDVIPQMVTGSVDGGFLMTGFFQHWGNNTNPCLIIKTDANGNELWRKKIGKAAPNVCDGKAIIQDSASKKIVIVGYQYIGPMSSFEQYEHILILDSTGNKKYQGKFYSSSGGGAYDLIQTPDKNFVVVGRKSYTYDVHTSDAEKAFAIKFNIDTPSIEIWKTDSAATINNYDLYASAKVMKNSDIMLAGGVFPIYEVDGVTYSQTGLVQRFTLIDNDGKVKSKKFYSYYSPEEGIQYYQSLTSFNTCSDGGYIAAISSNKYPGVNPFFVVKYDSTGCDSTLAYCAFVASGIDEFSSASGGSGSGFRVFPNPVSDELYINGNTQQTDNFELTIFDVSGREVKRTVIGSENKINTSDLSPGMYLLQIRKNGKLVYKSKIVKE